MGVLSIALILFIATILQLPEGTPVDESCLVISGRDVLHEEFPNTTLAGVLLLRCVIIEDFKFIFRAGKIDPRTLATECQDAPLFSFVEEEDREDLPIEDKPSLCIEGECVIYAAENSTVRLSQFLLEEDISEIRSKGTKISFLVTDLLFDFEGLLGTFAKSLLLAFKNNVNDPLALRGLVFLASDEARCFLPER
ncbi:unnamed protein product [Agarophyton chilense]